MKIEIAVTTYEMVDVIEALTGHIISWDWSIVRSSWAEDYYLAEADDIILEVAQESIGSDGSLNQRALFYLEASTLCDSPKKADIVAYVKEHKERIIPHEEIWMYM